MGVANTFTTAVGAVEEGGGGREGGGGGREGVALHNATIGHSPFGQLAPPPGVLLLVFQSKQWYKAPPTLVFSTSPEFQ